MSCTNCNSNNRVIYYPINNSTCATSTSTCSTSVDAECVTYTGANLTSINTESNDNLQEILEKLNTIVGALEGVDWSSYDYSGLDSGDPIATAQDFAELISSLHDALQTQVDTFIDSTYAGHKTAIEADITALEEPGLTSCTAVGVVDTDNNSQVLTKILTNLCEVNTAINPSLASWNDYETVDPLPTTVTAGFNTVIDWIIALQASITDSTLPTFDTRNTCLAITSASESLYNTVTYILAKLCELPTFDIDDLTWQSCITNPNPAGGADLLSTLNTIVEKLNNTYSNRVVEWDSDYFETSYFSSGEACSGLSVTLKAGVGLSDQLVALNGSDTSPDYLLNKMTAGDNITFDTATTPGTVIIDCDQTNDKVKADSGDTTEGYLIDKIEGQADATAAIDIVESYNATTDKVDLTPVIDYEALASYILSNIDSNNTLLTTFNAMVCAAQPCPEGETKEIQAVITVIDGSTAIDFNATFSQANPTLAMYTSGDVTAEAGDVITTGKFTVTSASLPVTGILTIVNNDGGATLPYNIYVLDSEGAIVDGATDQTGIISAGGTLTINPFSYGSETFMNVQIELGDGITTSTTTTTTTTAP